MIHVTLIDYKRLYEDALKETETLKETIKEKDWETTTLKKAHNELVERNNKLEGRIVEIKTEQMEKMENLADIVGGEGSLEDRIYAIRELNEHLHAALRYTNEEIIRKDGRIAELLSENAEVNATEAFMELKMSYDRLHDDYYSLKEMYDNAQKTIDRLCGNE